MGFGIGGNLPIDGSLFLEFIPNENRELMSVLSVFFPIGGLIGAGLSWILLPLYSCSTTPLQSQNSTDVTSHLNSTLIIFTSDVGSGPLDLSSLPPCDSSQNRGWRYVLFASSIFTLSLLLFRMFFVKMYESPRWYISVGKREQAAEVLNELAKMNNVALDITPEELPLISKQKKNQSGNAGSQVGLGVEEGVASKGRNMNGFEITWMKFKMLFRSDLLVYVVFCCFRCTEFRFLTKCFSTTLLVWSIWMTTAGANAIFYSFLPQFIKLQGGGKLSDNDVYRDNFIQTIFGIPGSLAGYFLIKSRLGRRFTMSIAAFGVGASFFVFTISPEWLVQIIASSLARFLADLFSGVIYTYTVCAFFFFLVKPKMVKSDIYF